MVDSFEYVFQLEGKNIANIAFAKDPPHAHDRLEHVPERKINIIVTIISMTAAIGFLISAVWVLWHTHDFVNKLAWLTGFVVAFSLWVGLLSVVDSNIF